jgi:pimeloyl-ACP methyl ester carboxylesterase
MKLYSDIFYQSVDGLTLHARDYNVAPPGRTPILCMPGLTRNVRDFDGLAQRLCRQYRVITTSQRGRGLSAYDPKPENYHPGSYVVDMGSLLEHLGLDKVTAIGTSLGGLMAMIMASGSPHRLAGIFLNDIGPEIDVKGLDKIRTYVDRVPQVANWQQAADDIKTLFAASFPLYVDEDWRKFARALYRENEDGVPVLDYDRAIALNVKAGEGAPAPDLWPIWDAMPAVPIAVLRGQRSDLLTEATLKEMQKRRPQLLVAEVPEVGHAPTLEEPAAIALVDRFLDEVRGRPLLLAAP